MNQPHDIEGTLQLLATQQGGRQTPALSGYRPQHKLHDNYHASGQHTYLGTGQVAPGETANVAVTFATPDVYPHSLWVGREIDVLEGPRVVGKLTVTHILKPILRGNAETYSPIWVEPPGLDKNGQIHD